MTESSSPVTPAGFTFEREVRVSEAQYVALFGPRLLSGIIRVSTLAACGVACLFWPYTVGLGVVVILFCLMVLLVPSVIPAGLRRQYRESTYLHDPFTCGVSGTEVWLRSAAFESRSQWTNVVVWREQAGWVVLSPHGVSPAFFRVDDLKTDGCYDHVMALARTHARQHGK